MAIGWHPLVGFLESGFLVLLAPSQARMWAVAEQGQAGRAILGHQPSLSLFGAGLFHLLSYGTGWLSVSHTYRCTLFFFLHCADHPVLGLLVVRPFVPGVKG